MAADRARNLQETWLLVSGVQPEATFPLRASAALSVS